MCVCRVHPRPVAPPPRLIQRAHHVMYLSQSMWMMARSCHLCHSQGKADSCMSRTHSHAYTHGNKAQQTRSVHTAQETERERECVCVCVCVCVRSSGKFVPEPLNLPDKAVKQAVEVPNCEEFVERSSAGASKQVCVCVCVMCVCVCKFVERSSAGASKQVCVCVHTETQTHTRTRTVRSSVGAAKQVCGAHTEEGTEHVDTHTHIEVVRSGRDRAR